MTTTTLIRSPRPTSTATSVKRLRLVLMANAATSAIGGAIAAVAADPVARWLGVDSGTGRVATRLVGIGLLVFAAEVAMTSRAKNVGALRRNTVLISAADIAWVLATVVVLAAGVLSTGGTWIAVLMGVGVADFAAMQIWLHRQTALVSPTANDADASRAHSGTSPG